jgi:hypothetical protein
MIMHRTDFIRFAAGLACLTAIAGCHTLRPVAAAQVKTTSEPRLWVTRADHSTIVLDDPRVHGDTPSGVSRGEARRVALLHAIAIRARRSAPVRTAVVVVASGAFLLGGIIYMEHIPDVGDATTCETGRFGDLPVPCCQVQADPSGPC